MKSGIITQRDPYLLDPSILVDPNLILDYGASVKDDSFTCNPVDPLMDLINYDDTQLENIILNSDFCGTEYDNPWAENEFEELLKDIVLNQVLPSELNPETAVKLEELSACSIETEVANFEEVYACTDESGSLQVECAELENTDCESVHSNYSESSSTSTRKRKLSDTSTCSSLTVVSVAAAPKRRKTRRGKRVQDERVKNQNKVAAMKYRKKKKDEKDCIDDVLQAEEEKNRKLKASMEELKVNIDVLKELLGKYLSPSQMKVNAKK